MRSAFIGAAMLAFGLAVGLSVSSSRPKPEQPVPVPAPAQRPDPILEGWRQSERDWQASVDRQRQRTADYIRDVDQREAERRAYELGQADGEGYAEDQARH